jgi:hypothetical protein
MGGWEVYYQLLDRLEEEYGPDDTTVVLFSFDETSLRKIVAKSMICGREQIEALGGGKRREVPTDVLQLDCSLGMTICHDRRVEPIDPLLVVNNIAVKHQQVMEALFFTSCVDVSGSCPLFCPRL